ncbi:hypothetical protein FQA47_011102 [Oryzias melastigma]|uniref:Secreted protein n=1 Tax=Oryzias melastigma TaxID=30732 RepID=A0A834EYZ4_ORYME|nr:hypothetical protein FQA47_011102 [Oryzias melastigma]
MGVLLDLVLLCEALPHTGGLQCPLVDLWCHFMGMVKTEQSGCRHRQQQVKRGCRTERLKDGMDVRLRGRDAAARR